MDDRALRRVIVYNTVPIQFIFVHDGFEAFIKNEKVLRFIKAEVIILTSPSAGAS